LQKILEKIIAFQLSSVLECHHLLPDHLQGAYHHVRSADQILLYAADTIVQAMDKCWQLCAAILDLRKAFDSLDHYLLLDRLLNLEVFGIKLQLLSDYLSKLNHKQWVKCGD